MFLELRILKLSLSNIEIIVEKNEEIQINYLSKINCFQNEDLYIQCIYTIKEKSDDGKEKYNHVVSLFNNTNLKMEYTEILQENYNKENSFDSTLQLNGNIFVTGFSLPNDRNIVKLLFKKFIIDNSNSDNIDIKLVDYLPNIPFININEDNQYIINEGLDKNNNMIKISEYKFGIILNELTNSSCNIIILIVNIFDNSNISIRHYKINLDLYNLRIQENLRGYIFNNFLGVLLETTAKTNTNITKAIFMTFGYINSTFDEIPLDNNLKENNTDSVIKIADYISEIENNLFAYELIGIKIINLPDPKCGIAGYFINNKTNEEIKEGDLLSVDAVLRYILVRPIILAQECSIDFAGVVKEPDFDQMNKNAERVDIYPVNNYELERNFYFPKTLIGRTIKYRFSISCYDTCDGCYNITNNPNNQQCYKCNENSYFINGTRNCFEYIDGYYFNNETQTFFPCYSSCETCNKKELNSTYMNCLTCKSNYTF